MSMQDAENNIRKGIQELGKGGDNTGKMLEFYRVKRTRVGEGRNLFEEAARLLVGAVEGTIEDETMMLETTVAATQLSAKDALEAFNAARLDTIPDNDAQETLRIAADVESKIGYMIQPMNNAYLRLQGELAGAITAVSELITQMENHMDGTIVSWQSIPPLAATGVQHAQDYLNGLNRGGA
jgi:hypothetical protein